MHVSARTISIPFPAAQEIVLNQYSVDSALNDRGIGRRYDGQWARGLMEGRGTKQWVNGDKYVGEWREGKQHGQGTFTWSEGNTDGRSEYRGEWQHGVRDGRGVKFWADGSQYDGDWSGNIKEGRGVLKMANGNMYEGQFKQDKKHGQGKFVWGDGPWKGHVYDGEWVEDRMEGKGEYTTMMNASLLKSPVKAQETAAAKIAHASTIPQTVSTPLPATETDDSAGVASETPAAETGTTSP